MKTKTTIQTILTWHEASDPPDADIEVLVQRNDGEVVWGYYDDEQHEYCNSMGLIIEARHWAHVTTPEVGNA